MIFFQHIFLIGLLTIVNNVVSMNNNYQACDGCCPQPYYVASGYPVQPINPNQTSFQGPAVLEVPQQYLVDLMHYNAAIIHHLLEEKAALGRQLEGFKTDYMFLYNIFFETKRDMEALKEEMRRIEAQNYYLMRLPKKHRTPVRRKSKRNKVIIRNNEEGDTDIPLSAESEQIILQHVAALNQISRDFEEEQKQLST